MRPRKSPDTTRAPPRRAGPFFRFARAHARRWPSDGACTCRGDVVRRESSRPDVAGTSDRALSETAHTPLPYGPAHRQRPAEPFPRSPAASAGPFHRRCRRAARRLTGCSASVLRFPRVEVQPGTSYRCFSDMGFRSPFSRLRSARRSAPRALRARDSRARYRPASFARDTDLRVASLIGHFALLRLVPHVCPPEGGLPFDSRGGDDPILRDGLARTHHRPTPEQRPAPQTLPALHPVARVPSPDLSRCQASSLVISTGPPRPRDPTTRQRATVALRLDSVPLGPRPGITGYSGGNRRPRRHGQPYPKNTSQKLG